MKLFSKDIVKTLLKTYSKKEVKNLIKVTKGVAGDEIVRFLNERLTKHPEEQQIITDYITLRAEEITKTTQDALKQIRDDQKEIEDLQEKNNVDISIFD